MQATERRSNLALELINAVPQTVLFFTVFAVAFAIRWFVLQQLGTDPQNTQISGDGAYYLAWAHSIAAGQWIGRDVFYPSPLYPYFVAVFQRFVSPQLPSLMLLQAIIGAAGCGLLTLATRRFFSPVAGVLAGLMLAFYPAAISYDLQIDKTVLDMPLLAATLFCLAGGLHRPRMRRWFACGVALGIFSLTRENALALLLPIVIALALQFRHRPRRQRTAWTAMLLLGVIVAVFPVCLRNSLLGGQFYLSTAKFGANFYYGNSAQADGIYFPLRPGHGDLRYEQADATEIAERAEGHSLTVGGVSTWWTHRTLDDIAADPRRWIVLSIKKFAIFFCDTEIADADVHDRHIVFSPILRALDAVWGFRVVLMLSAAGAALSWRSHRSLVLLLLSLTLVYAAAIALFIVFGRYRLPAVPLLLPLAAAGLTQLPGKIYARRWLTIIFAFVAAISGFAVSSLGEHFIPPRIVGTNLYNRGNIAAAAGRRPVAIAYYQQALRANPYLAAACTNLALQLADAGQLIEAESFARRGVTLDLTDSSAHINLGMILARRHRLTEAADEFRAALNIDPDNTAAKTNLKVLDHLATRPAS